MERPDMDPLIAGLVAGEERAYAALYDRFGLRLYRTALSIVRRREEAEDTVQEVFLSVLKSRHKLRGVQDLTAYLFTALRRAAGRAAAQRARGPALSQETVNAAPAAASPQDESGPCGELLQRALLSLPAEQRDVILLKIDGDLTFAQIGQVLGVSMNTAASRYRYALEKLPRDFGGVQMTENFPLPPELMRLEQDLAARAREQPSAQLKQRCVNGLRTELRRREAGGRWAFAVAVSATVLVGLNLSLSASQATDCGLRLDGRQQSAKRTADEIRQLLPDVSAQEAMRQAVLLRARGGVVPCPVVSPECVALDNKLMKATNDF